MDNNAVELRIRALVDGTDQVRALDSVVRALSGSLGDNTNALRQVQQSMNQFSASLVDLQQKHQQTRASVSGLGDEIKGLGEKIKAGIGDPMGAAKQALMSFADKLGPVGIGIGAVVSTIGAMGVASLEAMKSLGELGTTVHNISVITGLSTKEVGQFGFAAKLAGADVQVFQTAMRVLSRGLEDSDAKGRAAASQLRALGIETRDSLGALRPMSDVFLQISEKMSGMATAAERNTTAITLFGRAGMDLVPVMEKLADGVARAKELGLGLTPEEVAKFEKYHQEMVEIEAAWDRLKRKFKEPLAAVITFILQTGDGKALTLDDLRKMGISTALPNASKAGNDPMERDFRVRDANSRMAGIAGYLESYDDAKRIRDGIDRDMAAREHTKAGLTEALQRSKEDEASALKAYRDYHGFDSGKAGTLKQDWESARDKTEGLEKQLKALQEAGHELKRQAEILKTVTHSIEEYKRKSGEQSPWTKLMGEYDEKARQINQVKDPEQRQKLRDQLNASVAERESAIIGKVIEAKALADMAVQDSITWKPKHTPSAESIVNMLAATQLQMPMFGAPLQWDRGYQRQQAEHGLRMTEIQHPEQELLIEQQKAALVHQEFDDRIEAARVEGDLLKAQEIQNERDTALQQLKNENAERQAGRQQQELDKVKNEATSIFDAAMSGHGGVANLMRQQAQHVAGTMVGNAAGMAYTAMGSHGPSSLFGGQWKTDGSGEMTGLGKLLQNTPFAQKPELHELKGIHHDTTLMAEAQGKAAVAIAALPPTTVAQAVLSSAAADFSVISQGTTDSTKTRNIGVSSPDPDDIDDVGVFGPEGAAAIQRMYLGYKAGQDFMGPGNTVPYDVRGHYGFPAGHSEEKNLTDAPDWYKTAVLPLDYSALPLTPHPALSSADMLASAMPGMGKPSGLNGILSGVTGIAGMAAGAFGHGTTGGNPAAALSGAAMNLNTSASALQAAAGKIGMASTGTMGASGMPGLAAALGKGGFGGLASAFGMGASGTGGGFLDAFTGVAHGDGWAQNLTGAQRFAAGLGGAATIAGGTISAIQQFKQGGARGALGGVSSILGTAAAVDPEPISKAVLGASAMVMGIVKAFMPDPRAEREKEITRAESAAREAASIYTMTPQHLTMDSFGHAAIADLRGVGYTSTALAPRLQQYNQVTGFDPYHFGMTTSASEQMVGYVPAPPAHASQAPTTINLTIHALDSKSIMDRSPDIATALSKELMGTHRISSDIRHTANPR